MACYKLLKFYRGTKQTQEEIQRLKNSIGHLILTNGFLSTSENREVAEMYAGIGIVNINANSNNLESIIYEINYNTDIHPSTIVADITCYSRFRDEQEFLLDIGTVFKIEDVDALYTFRFYLIDLCYQLADNHGYWHAINY